MRKSEATGVDTTRTSFGGGRYQALEVQGRGGTAVVYRARDVVLDRLVALKWLAVPEGASHARDTKALFEREFRTLSNLSHPNIIEVYDYGVDAGAAFYTMEFVEGPTSAMRHRTPGRRPARSSPRCVRRSRSFILAASSTGTSLRATSAARATGGQS